jgi:hypothetical protein
LTDERWKNKKMKNWFQIVLSNEFSLYRLRFGSQVMIVGFGLRALWFAESSRVKGQMRRIWSKTKTLHEKVRRESRRQSGVKPRE